MQKFSKKGQGALEYLLLIGGAVLIAVIVVALLIGMGIVDSSNTQQNKQNVENSISGLAVPPILNVAICNDTTPQTLDIRYQYNGGIIDYKIDDDAWMPLSDTTGTISILTASCIVDSGEHQIQLNATNDSGHVATSNILKYTT